MEIKGVQFIYNEKLGIKVPSFERDWDDFSKEEQAHISHQWERERSQIPDRIQELEAKIDELHDHMYKDPDSEDFFTVHLEIVHLASAINDLNILSRTVAEVKTDEDGE